MFKNLNKNSVFIGSTCLFSLAIALGFEFLVNLVFPQPSFFFSRSRFIAVAGVISSSICLIKYRKYFYENLHQAFLLISLVFGISFILVFPRTVYLSPDDQIHFKNAYFFMDDTVELRGGFSAIESISFTNVDGKGFDEMAAMYSSMNNANNIVINDQYHPSDSPRLYSRIVYLPFYLGFKISNLFHLSFTTSIIIAKIFNLICYILLVYFAIKESGRFNRIFFVIGLLACNIFLATQFSYDPLVLGSLLLAISLFLHIRQTEHAPTSYLLGFILAAIFGSLSKAVYCPILLLALIIPNSKFDCKKRAIAFKICAMFVMLVLASTFILPILSGGLASDIRGGDTSVSGQIGFLISNPLKALTIIFTYITNQWPNLILDPTMSFTSLGAVATAAPIHNICLPIIPMVGMLSLLVILWSTFSTNLSGTSITKQSKIGLAIIYTILLGATTASMYLSFTSVGSTHVDGVQPRYLMPFFPLFLIPLMPFWQTRSKEESPRNSIVLMVPYLCLLLILSTYILQVSRL